MTRKELRAKYGLTKDEYKEILKVCGIPDKQYLSKRELKLFEDYITKARGKKPKKSGTKTDVTHSDHMKRLFAEVKAKYPHLNNKVIRDIVEMNYAILKSYIKEGKSYRVLGLFTIQKPRKKAGEIYKAFGKEITLKRHITTMKLSKKAREVE